MDYAEFKREIAKTFSDARAKILAIRNRAVSARKLAQLDELEREERNDRRVHRHLIPIAEQIQLRRYANRVAQIRQQLADEHRQAIVDRNRKQAAGGTERDAPSCGSVPACWGSQSLRPSPNSLAAQLVRLQEQVAHRIVGLLGQPE